MEITSKTIQNMILSEKDYDETPQQTIRRLIQLKRLFYDGERRKEKEENTDDS